MKCGLTLPAVQQIPGRSQSWEASAGAPEILTVARAADRLGFHHLSVCDHVAIAGAQAAEVGAVWYDPAVTLAFVAAATSRIRLLSHVVVLPYRHPLVVAKSFATLDHLSGGRVILGVGSGHLQSEFRSLAVSYADRGRITDEYVQAIAAAWEHEGASFHGRYVEFEDVVVAPRPQQRPRPPIWVGGNSRAAVRRAARYADGWIPWSITPAEFSRTVAYAEAVGQTPVERGPRGCGPPGCGPRGSAAGVCSAGPDKHREYVAPLVVRSADGPAALTARVAEWRAAGATAFHVSLAHTSLTHLLERMTMFAETLSLGSS